MLKFVSRFLSEESGATAIEYALIASLISISIIGGATAVGNSSIFSFEQVSEALTNE